MDRYQVEVWSYLRDNAKPISERDAHDLAQARTFTPPSRKLLKRIARAQAGKDGNIPKNPEPPKPLSERAKILRRQNEFHKRVIQQLGGSLTVAAPPVYEPKPIQYFEQNGPIEQKSERERMDETRRRLAREHIRAMGKRVYEDYQPDMFEVLDAYGDFDHYRKG